jgi:hypothetical protein
LELLAWCPCRKGEVIAIQRLQHREARGARQHVPRANPPGIAFRPQNRLQEVCEAGILTLREVLGNAP